MKPLPERPAPRIYTPQALATGAAIVLDDSAARHVAGALRLQPGAALVLFNGEGGEYRAHLEQVEKRRVQARVEEFVDIDRESDLKVYLGLAVSRGDRMDYAVQKSTELGVTAIHPLETARTEVRLSAERWEKKRAHWQQVAISACEQCGRNRPPVIEAVRSLDDWLGDAPGERKLVLHHRSETGLAGASAPSAVSLLIGPEGGLSEAELEGAGRAGFEGLRLGPRVLRTETAPVAALAIIQSTWGDIH